jgi:hypothetical protein
VRPRPRLAAKRQSLIPNPYSSIAPVVIHPRANIDSGASTIQERQGILSPDVNRFHQHLMRYFGPQTVIFTAPQTA